MFGWTQVTCELVPLVILKLTNQMVDYLNQDCIRMGGLSKRWNNNMVCDRSHDLSHDLPTAGGP